jgi:ribosomal protein S18 acetylase RimI-like enzyme
VYFGEHVAHGGTSEPRVDDMNPQIEPRHALSPNEIDAIEDRLYEYNSQVTGRYDGQGLAFMIRDELGRMIGVAAGYTWAGTSELKQMWVDKSYRGRGYARALLDAFVTEACSRGVSRIWVASYDFQAPGIYEKAGFKRTAEFKNWPEGHINVLLCKTLSGHEN